MTPWPRCSAEMRNGQIQVGEVAHRGTTHTTVRFDVPPWEIPGVWGKQTITFSYQDIPNQFVRLHAHSSENEIARSSPDQTP